MISLLKSFIPSGLRIKKRPAFLCYAFEGEWSSVMYDMEKRLVELLLKESEEDASIMKQKYK